MLFTIHLLGLKGSITELDPKKTQEAINVTCFGAFLVAQESSKRMLKRKSGSIFFTGATAGIKGFAKSSVFAMGKFGLRGSGTITSQENFILKIFILVILL